MAQKDVFEAFPSGGGQGTGSITLSENAAVINNSDKVIYVAEAADLLAYYEQVEAEISLADCAQDDDLLICQATETNKWGLEVAMEPLEYEEFAFIIDAEGDVEEISLSLAAESEDRLANWIAYRSGWLEESDTAVSEALFTPDNQLIYSQQSGQQMEDLFEIVNAKVEELFELFAASDEKYYAGDFEEAVVIYEQILAMKMPLDMPTMILVNHGDANDNLGNYEEAIESYLLAVEIVPDDPNILNKLCWDYGLTEQPEKALPYCEEAVWLDPSPAHLDSRGLTFGLLGDYEAAIVDFELVISDLEYSSDPELAAIASERSEWVAMMEAGENPFTAAEMAELRRENYIDDSPQEPADIDSGVGVEALVPMESVELGMLYGLPSDWTMEKSGDESCAAGACPELLLSKNHPEGAVSSITFSALSPQSLGFLEELMSGPEYNDLLVGSLPGRSRVDESYVEGLIYLAPGEAVQFFGQWQDSPDDISTVDQIINSLRSMALESAVSDTDPVSFYSDWLAEITGVAIGFQHPRSWQTSYFSDSGAAGWLISDADPTQAYWHTLSEGDELSLYIVPAEEPYDTSEMPLEGAIQENDEYDTDVFYIFKVGSTEGVIVLDDMAFQFSASYPQQKEFGMPKGIETILSTFNWIEREEKDISPDRWIGLRTEGVLEIGSGNFGYVPLASISLWMVEGRTDQEVELVIDTFAPAVPLILDIFDGNGQSILPSGAEFFIGSLTLDSVIFPADGTYYIQVAAQTSFVKLSPANPPAENKIYGWYEISLDSK